MTEPDHRGAPPDVSVVVPVYNTMPYLTRCLASLAEQTIGAHRMEVIAIDDGSTDGSGRQLDRFARRHPELIRVIHQENSGGPAGPCNRGLELATGRYVYFVGADDYLGREALARLVAAADRYQSDVVLGRAVGVNNRYVHQQVYARTAPEIDLFDPDCGLRWSLANIKLFRRGLIERHGLRFPEDMPVNSDQPFTIEALYRARRITVLADYDYYYAVRRLNARNITYSTRHLERLRGVTRLMDFVADLIEPGKRRDTILVRHFSWELAKLLGDDFVQLDRQTQERVHAGVRELAERYLTDDIRDELDIEVRMRLAAARYGMLDDLIAVIRQDAEQGVPPMVVIDGRRYAGYRSPADPGRAAPSADVGSVARAANVDGAARSADTDGAGPSAGADGAARPPAWQDVTAVAADWVAKLDVVSTATEAVGGGRRAIVITARSPLPDLADLVSSPVRITAEHLEAETVSMERDGAGTVVRARFPVDTLVAASAPRGHRWNLRARVEAFNTAGSAALRGPHLTSPARALCRHGRAIFLVSVARDRSGQIVVAVTPLTPRRVIGRLRGAVGLH